MADLYDTGYRGFLIGEAFMKADPPALACKQFIQELRRLQAQKTPQPVIS